MGLKSRQLCQQNWPRIFLRQTKIRIRVAVNWGKRLTRIWPQKQLQTIFAGSGKNHKNTDHDLYHLGTRSTSSERIFPLISFHTIWYTVVASIVTWLLSFRDPQMRHFLLRLGIICPYTELQVSSRDISLKFITNLSIQSILNVSLFHSGLSAPLECPRLSGSSRLQLSAALWRYRVTSLSRASSR